MELQQPTPLTSQNPPENKPEDKQEAKPSTPAQPQSGAGHIDLGKILLPKKETPGQTTASAERINAGALLEQEQSATLLTPASEVEKPAPVRLTEAPKDDTAVKSIETYQGDIEGVVKDKNISILSIAAAEAERRGSQQISGGAASTPSGMPGAKTLTSIALYVLGFVFLAGASGALAYILERPTSVGAPAAAPTAPFIAVDDTKDITIAPTATRASVMSTLTAAKEATALSLGLMSRLLVTVASTTPSGTQGLEALSAQSFFTLIAPDMPQALLRAINPNYLLGVHVYDNNQPFIIMSVDSYEQAYAGMLAWEPSMQQDLSPLFNYTPPVHIPEEQVGASTVSTSSPQANAAASTTPPASPVAPTGFVDSIVENHDARVIQNSTGDITLLWTFLDRNTLVITTQGATLREIISRLQEAPVTSSTGQ